MKCKRNASDMQLHQLSMQMHRLFMQMHSKCNANALQMQKAFPLNMQLNMFSIHLHQYFMQLHCI